MLAAIGITLTAQKIKSPGFALSSGGISQNREPNMRAD